MATILCQTNGNANPKGKPRVYFTCHPEDFDKYFPKLSQDIWQSHDCAIYYTEDMTQTISQQDTATDLERHNLFIVPVSFRLLSTPNRAMDLDIPLALSKHIPVLPFMMEPNLDQLYAAKFGELQYLNPYSTDTTEISYAEKLKKYLEAVLISDTLAQRIRAAFGAYIFLSYRKKDRRYANALMQQIHSHPECADVAIWFDEFLTPGESFRANIENALQKSKLFTLLVTPNLLEEPDGKPNFVMAEEYPAAREAHIPIVPVEMVETDKDALCRKFADIPPCFRLDDPAFVLRICHILSRSRGAVHNDSPMHNFLIGLAYLEGIDMEIDKVKGLSRIHAAAEAALPEAMEKLRSMYSTGAHVSLNYQEAARWALRLAQHNCDTLGQEHPDTLAAQNNAAVAYNAAGEFQKALPMLEQVYALECKLFGEDDLRTLNTLGNLAQLHRLNEHYAIAQQLQEQAYERYCAVWGQTHPGTLKMMNNLAMTCFSNGEHARAGALFQNVYKLLAESKGQEHPDTLTALSNLALVCNKTNQADAALALDSTVYSLRQERLGQTHPDTLTSLNNLALSHSHLQHYQTALELNQQSYQLHCSVLGKTHPATLNTLNNLACSHVDLGEYPAAIELLEQAYDGYCQHGMQESYGAMTVLHSLGNTYYHCTMPQKAMGYYEKAYMLGCKLLDLTHPDTQTILDNMIDLCKNVGDLASHTILREQKYMYLSRKLGQQHPQTMSLLGELVIANSQLRNWRKTAQLAQLLYSLRKNLLGEEHPHTLTALNNLASAYGYLGELDKELACQEQVCALLEKTQGKRDPNTLTALNNLAVAYGRQKQWNQAAQILQELFALRSEVLGERHKDTLVTLGNLICAQQALGKTQQAEQLQKLLDTLRSQA